jgi:hypothetical protein
VDAGSERTSAVEFASAGDSPAALPLERQGALYARSESRGVYRRETVEQGLDFVEIGAQPTRVDETGGEECVHVLAVARVVALELREGLRVRIEVVEGEPPATLDEHAALLPAGGQGNEVAGRGELDVDRQLVLQARDRPQDGVLLGNELEVDVDGRGSPAEEDRRCPTRQVAEAFLLGRRVEGGDELLDSLAVG